MKTKDSLIKIIDALTEKHDRLTDSINEISSRAHSMAEEERLCSLRREKGQLHSDITLHRNALISYRVEKALFEKGIKMQVRSEYGDLDITLIVDGELICENFNKPIDSMERIS